MTSRVSKRTQAERLKPKLKPTLKTSRPIKESLKPKVTISTAPILKRQLRNENYPKKSIRKSKRFDHELILDFQASELLDDIETCRTSICAEAHAALGATHAELNKSLMKMHLQNMAAQEQVSTRYSALVRPLSEEQIETTFTRSNGMEVTEVRQIGKRVEEFKVMVTKNEAELKKCWAEWEEVQEEIDQLGVDILGPGTFEKREGFPESRSAGYTAEIDRLDQEHKTFLQKMRREIKSLCLNAWEKMEAGEKEIDLHVRNQKKELLARLFEDDDD